VPTPKLLEKELNLDRRRLDAARAQQAQEAASRGDTAIFGLPPGMKPIRRTNTADLPALPMPPPMGLKPPPPDLPRPPLANATAGVAATGTALPVPPRAASVPATPAAAASAPPRVGFGPAPATSAGPLAPPRAISAPAPATSADPLAPPRSISAPAPAPSAASLAPPRAVSAPWPAPSATPLASPRAVSVPATPAAPLAPPRAVSVPWPAPSATAPSAAPRAVPAPSAAAPSSAQRAASVPPAPAAAQSSAPSAASVPLAPAAAPPSPRAVSSPAVPAVGSRGHEFTSEPTSPAITATATDRFSASPLDAAGPTGATAGDKAVNRTATQPEGHAAAERAARSLAPTTPDAAAVQRRSPPSRAAGALPPPAQASSGTAAAPIPGPGGPWRSQAPAAKATPLPPAPDRQGAATEPAGVRSIHREPLPPHGDEIYRRVTRPDMPAATAAARAMDPRVEQEPSPKAASQPPRTHSSPTVDLRKGAAAQSLDPRAPVDDEPTVRGPIRADLLRASAEDGPTAPQRVPPIANPGDLLAAQPAQPTSPPKVPGAALADAFEEPETTAPNEGEVRSATVPVVEVHARAAPLWRRALAGGVDLGVQTVLVTACLAGLISSGKLAGLELVPTSLTGLDALVQRLHASQALLTAGGAIVTATVFLYSALFAMLWQGRSPGRRLAGIRLVDSRGTAPSPLRAILRAGLALVSFGLLLGGFWVSLFDRRGQTLHDRLTSTFVVRPS